MLASSRALVQSNVPRVQALKEGGFRAVYLKHPELVPAPVTGVDSVIPRSLVTHLLTQKKDTAITVKFETGNQDKITNLEGALHSLVIPVVPSVLIQGDYKYDGGHRVTPFASGEMQLAREVVLSALVQPDFEDQSVMFELIRLEAERLDGQDLPFDWKPMSIEAKQDDHLRAQYDHSLKAFAVFQFRQGYLPSSNEVSTVDEAELLRSLRSRPPGNNLDIYLKTEDGHVLSIPLLKEIMFHQIYIELRTLEDVCPDGYIYTWDPPAIFAKTIGADILDELWFWAIANALKKTGSGMKLLAFNDYRNPHLLERLKFHIKLPVISKTALFFGPNHDLKTEINAPIVIHNNSDAFGQNIQFESSSGSLDGAVGACSSAAGSLLRERRDLLDEVSIYIYS